MNAAVTHNILTGALAAGIIFASPLAASAATPASVPSIAQYDGAPIPSSIADLTSRATIVDSTPVYGEPASTLNFSVPKWSAETAVSQPFDAHGEPWVAISVPVDAKGTTFTKSIFSEAGVGYIRASCVTFAKAAPSAPADSAGAYPTKMSELKMAAYVTEPKDLYLTPSLLPEQKLTGKGSHIDAGTTASSSVYRFGDSSDIFSAGGHKWVAVPTAKSLVPGGIAYLPADSGVRVESNGSAVVNPVQPSSQPTAPGPSQAAVPTASATPTETAEPTATTAPAPVAAEPASTRASSVSTEPNWLAAIVSVLFGALVIVPLYKLKSRGA